MDLKKCEKSPKMVQYCVKYGNTFLENMIMNMYECRLITVFLADQPDDGQLTEKNAW